MVISKQVKIWLESSNWNNQFIDSHLIPGFSKWQKRWLEMPFYLLQTPNLECRILIEVSMLMEFCEIYKALLGRYFWVLGGGGIGGVPLDCHEVSMLNLGVYPPWN